MDSILAGLNALRESQYWPLVRLALALILMAAPFILGIVVSRDDTKEQILAAVRDAFRHADISNTAAAIDAQIGESLVSKKLRGEKPLTVDFLATQSPDLMRWIGLELIRSFGMPEVGVMAARVSLVIPAKES